MQLWPVLLSVKRMEAPTFNSAFGHVNFPLAPAAGFAVTFPPLLKLSPFSYSSVSWIRVTYPVCVLNSIGKLCVVHESTASFCSMHQYGTPMQSAPWKFVRFLFVFSVRSAIESWSSRRCLACEQTQNDWVKQASYNRIKHD